MDIFTIENFLNDDDINLANALKEKEESFFDTEGVYKGKITLLMDYKYYDLKIHTTFIPIGLCKITKYLLLIQK